MVMCETCRLAQLESDPTGAEEPLGLEPAALVRQAGQAVDDLVAAGLAQPGARVEEFPSPHGGNWSGLLRAAGLVSAPRGHDRVDLVVDSLGLMHSPDQRKALAERVERLAPDGVLAMHVHPMGSILRQKMWNVLRHGHFAYYSVPVLVEMAAEFDLVPVAIFTYSLYGGTVVVAFARTGSQPAVTHGALSDNRIRSVVDGEHAAGAADPDVVGSLGRTARESALVLRDYLHEGSRRGLRIAGFGAASRAIALLSLAGVGPADVRVVADSADAKQGRAIPGSRIPIVPPEQMVQDGPDRVLLFVADLLPEVRESWPQIEARSARWVLLDPVPEEVVP